jgi:starch-binding outer membrane protein, SusD/RagB family
MMKAYKKGLGAALTVAVTMTAAGCKDILDVRNPAVVEATTIDPVTDAPVLSFSAFQNFATFYGAAIVHSGWFSHEIWVGDTFPTRNQYGFRLIDDRNTTHNNELWFPLGRAASSADDVLSLAGAAPGADQSVHIARAAMSSGFSVQMMAELFCRGTVASMGEPGPVLETADMLNRAVERFQRAITVGLAASTATGAGHTAATRAEALVYVNASRVGLGRAHLQAGRNAEAIAAVNAVPAAFNFDVRYVDDPGSRGRLGNGVFFNSAGGSRENVVVPPVYRAMNDPRIEFADAGRDAQDGTLRLWTQRKYPNWGAPIRLASGLEARYIVAEAELKQGNPASALALIAERRAVGNQGAFAGTGDEILRELMSQRSRDFWIEGKRMGDIRRNPGMVPNVPAAGDPYYKPEIETQIYGETCMPVPAFEVERNPFFR